MEENKKLRIVVFPWLAFGHMIPFLELSKALAQRGHHIYFISTPRNIQRLRPKVSDDISDLIQFVPLQLPKVSGLPLDAESTFDVPQSKVDYLKIALDGLQHPFSNFIRDLNQKPDYIIQDFVQHWIPDIAAEAKVPTICFSIFIVTSLLFYGPPNLADSAFSSPEQLTVPPPWIPFPSNIRFRLHEARRMFSDCYTVNKSGITDFARVRLVYTHCSAVAVRGCTELEPDCFRVYPDICGKPVLPVGLLPPTESAVNHEGEIVRWLNNKRPRSVLYIAFGSEAAFSKEVAKVIADGVEEARVPFVWVCREELPDGFEERTKEYGMVVRGWVQQMDVLGHGSVGGVLTHCGWSTVVESLRFGLPLVVITVFVDQGITARVVVVGGGFGLEVERDEGDGSFTKEDVKRAVRCVMVDDEGESVRVKARELKRLLFSDVQTQNVYVDKFVGFLQNGTIV